MLYYECPRSNQLKLCMLDLRRPTKKCGIVVASVIKNGHILSNVLGRPPGKTDIFWSPRSRNGNGLFAGFTEGLLQYTILVLSIYLYILIISPYLVFLVSYDRGVHPKYSGMLPQRDSFLFYALN